MFEVGDLKLGVRTTLDGEPAIKFFTKKFILSNHFQPANFAVDIRGRLLNGHTNFNSSEQFYMAILADEFNEKEALAKIMSEELPSIICITGQRLGKSSDPRWKEKMERVMFYGVLEKFRQNWQLKMALLATKGYRLIEACSNREWATGLPLDSSENALSSKWKGANRLGKVLERVRDKLEMATIDNNNNPTLNLDDLNEFPPLQLQSLSLTEAGQGKKIIASALNETQGTSENSCEEVVESASANKNKNKLWGRRDASAEKELEGFRNDWQSEIVEKRDKVGEKLVEQFEQFGVKESSGKTVEYLVSQVEESAVVASRLRTMANKSWPHFVSISNASAENCEGHKRKLQMGDIVGVRKFEWRNEYRYLANRENEKSHWNKMWYVQKINAQASVSELGYINYAIWRKHPGLVLKIRDMVSGGVTKKLCAIIISPGLQLSSRCYRRQLDGLSLESLQEGQLITVSSALVPQQCLIDSSYTLPPQSSFRFGSEKQIEEGKGVLAIVSDHGPWPYQVKSRNVFYPFPQEMTVPEMEVAEQIISSVIAFSYEDEEKRILECKFEGRAEFANKQFWLKFSEIDSEKMKKMKEVWSEDVNVVLRTSLDFPHFAAGYVQKIDIEKVRKVGQPKFDFWIVVKVTNVQERKNRDVFAELEAAEEGAWFVVHPIIPLGMGLRRDCFSTNLPSKIASMDTNQGKLMRALLGRAEEIIEETENLNASATQEIHPLMGKLNAKQQKTVQLLLDDECKLVYQHAPPGVGKTHVAAIAAAILLAMNENIKIAVVTAANLPLAKLVQELEEVLGGPEMEEEGSVAFFSGYAKEKYKKMIEKLRRHILVAKVEDEETISKFQDKQTQKEVKEYCQNCEMRPRLTNERKIGSLYSEVAELRIIFASVTMAENLIFTALNGTSVVIFDEATQGSWVSLVHLVSRLPSLKKIFVTGDQFQLGVHLQKLPPLLQSGFGLESMVDQLALSPSVVQTRLTTCYRMHPILVEAVASAAYEPNGETLEPGRAAEDRSILTASNFPLPVQSCPIVLLNMTGKCRQDNLSHSLTNDSHTEAALQIASALKSRISSPNVSLVVICLYLFQKESIQIEFDRSGIDVLVVTVDGYQAQESDIVILVTTRSSLRDGILGENSEFLKDARRATVGLSRAKHGLFIIGDFKTLREGEVWDKFLQKCMDTTVIVGEDFLQVMKSGRYMRDRYGQLVDDVGRIVRDWQWLSEREENWRGWNHGRNSPQPMDSRKRRADGDPGPSARRSESWRPGPSIVERSGGCYVCGRFGHRARDCWHAPGQQRGRSRGGRGQRR